MNNKRNIKIVISLAMLAYSGLSAVRYDVTGANFNADKTGVSDASFAIQNALNKAKNAVSQIEVYFPEGNYRLNHALIVYSNTKLELHERARVFRSVSGPQILVSAGHLKADGTACSRDKVCIHGGYSQIHDVTIVGGIWDGNDSKSVTGAIFLPHGQRIRIENAVFHHFTEHIINLSGSRDIVLQNLEFMDMHKYDGTSSEFWTGYTKGDDRRFLSIEAIHLDVTNPAGEPTNYPHDNTVCQNVVVRNCNFSNVFAGIGNHHVINGYRNGTIDV